MTDARADHPAPDAALILALAAEAVAALPAPHAAAAAAVVLRVEEFPFDEMLEELGLEDPFELTGLYDGIPLTERGAGYEGMVMPDRITVFRQPLLAMCATEEELVEQVRITVVHEVAHHFGIDDARLHELGWA